MTDTYEKIKAEGKISTCPACGYKDGFHVAFDMDGNLGKGEIILICPDCHRQFKMGWQVTVT